MVAKQQTKREIQMTKRDPKTGRFVSSKRAVAKKTQKKAATKKAPAKKTAKKSSKKTK